MAEEDPFWKQLYPHRAEDFSKLQYYPYDAYASQWDRLARKGSEPARHT